jgi:type 1 glutamine amidotransferase
MVGDEKGVPNVESRSCFGEGNLCDNHENCGPDSTKEAIRHVVMVVFPNETRLHSVVRTAIRRNSLPFMNKILVLTLACAAVLTADAAEKKRVVVCTVTTGFRHSSIPFAEKTLEKLAAESGAYEIVGFVRQPEVNVPKKPNKPGNPKPDADEKAKAKYANDLKKYEEEMAKWTPEKDAELKAAQAKFDEQLKANMAPLSPSNLTAQKVDAVIFANTTGSNFPLPDKDGFIKWVENGGVFIGMHSATDTFNNWAPYYDMIQGTFNGHGPQVPADLIAADKAHPANGGIGEKWDLKQEEMYLIKNHDRAKNRELWYLNHHPEKPAEPGFFPVAWCREHGKGRVFYTSLGHREDLWSDDLTMKGRLNSVETSKQFQKHILGGIKWALGLEKGDATPNPEVK